MGSLAAVRVFHMLARVHHLKGGSAATFDNAGLGSCGVVAQDSDHVVALSAAQYSGGSACGRQIVVTREAQSIDFSKAW